MAQQAPVPQIDWFYGARPIEDTDEELADCQERIALRRALDKFGDCAGKGEGPERGITAQAPIAIQFYWKGEEKKVVEPPVKVAKKKTKYVAPQHRQRGTYNHAQQQREKRVLTIADKCRQLLEYCEAHTPQEPEQAATGKKKRKKKKQKLAHPMEFLSMFLELSISPPKSTANLPKTIQSLQELLETQT